MTFFHLSGLPVGYLIFAGLLAFMFESTSWFMSCVMLPLPMLMSEVQPTSVTISNRHLIIKLTQPFQYQSTL